LSSVFVLSSSVCCVWHRGGPCNACYDSGNVRASVGVFNRLRESEFTAPARVSLACLGMRAVFARLANRVIEHNALRVRVLGLCFLCALDYFL